METNSPTVPLGFRQNINCEGNEGSVSVIPKTYQNKDRKIDKDNDGEKEIEESDKVESSEERAEAEDAEETWYVGKTLGLFGVADDIVIQALMEDRMESKYQSKLRGRIRKWKNIQKDGNNPGGFPSSQ